LGKTIDLIVVPPRESEQLSDEFFKPTGALRKAD
jgi:hypothetical protein